MTVTETERDPFTPPHDDVAEEWVLGSVLRDQLAMASLRDLRSEDFYNPRYAAIWRAMSDLWERGIPVDHAMVSNRLATPEFVNAGVAVTDLLNIHTAIPTAAFAAHYAKIVMDTATQRRYVAAAQKIASHAYRSGTDIADLIAEAEASLNQARPSVSRRDLYSPEQWAQSFMDDLEMRREGKRTAVTTGIGELDEMLLGLESGALYLLMATAGAGKSELSLQIAMHVAQKHGVVLFASLEMSAVELAHRYARISRGMDRNHLATAQLSDSEWTRATETMSAMHDGRLWPASPRGQYTTADLRADALDVQAKQGKLTLIVADYVQRFRDRSTKISSREENVGLVAENLKSLAREFGCPVLAPVQPNRDYVQRTNKRPVLSDLRECVTGDTRVALASGETIPISELIGTTPKVVTLDGWRITTATAEAVWTVGWRSVFRVRSRSGRVVRATANHPFRTLNGWTPLEALSIGDRIAIPRRYPRSDRQPWPTDRLRLLAHMVGDGCYASGQQPHYTSASEANLAAVETAAFSAFSVTPRRVHQGAWQHIYFPSKASKWHRNPMTVWLAELGIEGQRSGDKYLPDSIFTLPDQQISEFLQHLWATDGTNYVFRAERKTQAHVYYATKSRRLAEQVQHLLARLDILSTIQNTHKAGYDQGYNVRVSGREVQLAFAHRVGGFGERAAQLADVVAAIEPQRANPNVDTIPHEVWDYVRQVMREHGISQRAMSAMRGTSYGGTSHYRFAPSRLQVMDYARLLNSAYLFDLINADTTWDTVVAIEADGEADVFDIAVPETHNFVGNGVILHNSGKLEQEADVVLGLYRDEKHDEQTRERGIAEVHMLKNRSGVGDTDGARRIAWKQTRYGDYRPQPGQEYEDLP